jgi:hypothetical protein
MPSLVNDQLSLYRHDVKPVLTEHSLALACLGELIDQAGGPRLTVYVEPIVDKTVPRRYEKRRLSLGGAYWVHTAIDKVGSDRVVSITKRPRGKAAASTLVLSGAWTQDDLGVGSADGALDGRWENGDTRTDFFLGARRGTDVIAGDFLSVRDGVVQHATAISLAVDSARAGVGLRIQDGGRDFAFDLSRSVVEGPQFAQRRVTEAAALVHLAHAFDVDYAPCIELGWASAQVYREKAADYFAMPQKERYRAVQKALSEAGYDPGVADGLWGARSANALMRFQADRGQPPTGRPSLELYLALQRSA